MVKISTDVSASGMSDSADLSAGPRLVSAVVGRGDEADCDQSSAHHNIPSARP